MSVGKVVEVKAVKLHHGDQIQWDKRWFTIAAWWRNGDRIKINLVGGMVLSEVYENRPFKCIRRPGAASSTPLDRSGVWDGEVTGDTERLTGDVIAEAPQIAAERLA